jgi:ankyrin repeat protein
VLDVMALLIDAGAPINAVDNRGRTALMTAAELGRTAEVEALLARGADRNITDKGGKSAVDLAANASVREQLAAQ